MGKIRPAQSFPQNKWRESHPQVLVTPYYTNKRTFFQEWLRKRENPNVLDLFKKSPVISRKFLATPAPSDRATVAKICF